MSVEKVIADVEEIAREIELEVGLEIVTELLQSHDAALMDMEVLLMDKQRKWSLEMKFTAGEDEVKTVDMTTKDLGYYINLVDKAVAGLEKTASNFERSPTLGKMLSNSSAYYREIAFFFFFFSFLAAQWHMEFPGQGSDLSHSCGLSCSCGNAGSLTHCAGQGWNLHPNAP